MSNKITKKDVLDVLSKIEGIIITQNDDRRVAFTHNVYGGDGWVTFKDGKFEKGNLSPWEEADLFFDFAIDEPNEIYYIIKAGLTAAKWKRKQQHERT